jgi:alpha-ketoglutarate-dependent taurine dioxygenase
MQFTPLDAPFGVRLDLATELPLTPEQGDEFRRQFSEHGLILLRGREISAEQQVDLLSQLGRVEPDASGHPMKMEVTNQHDQTTAPDGELIFHYDYAYDVEPIPAISMYGSLIEAGATPTLFASSSRVLDELPASLRTRLEDREAVHACFLFSPEAPEVRSIEPDPLIPRGAAGWGPEHYWARHPLVWRNAAGVPTLFACLQHTDRILGLSRDESDALLEEIYAHLYHSSNVIEHVWQPHDLVIWDNLTVQHARPDPKPAPRTLRRYHVSDVDLTDEYVRIARERGYM